MTDQELLELAAKAAGIEINKGLSGTLLARTDVTAWVEWNPLIDDGDALRLAVKLQLDVCPYVYFNERCQLPAVSKLRKTADGSWIEEKVSRFPEYSESFVKHDPYAATRRAIVKAAAAIGKSMGVTK